MYLFRSPKTHRLQFLICQNQKSFKSTVPVENYEENSFADISGPAHNTGDGS